MAIKKSNGLVTILSSSNSAIISVAKSLLEEAAIEYSVKSDGHENITAENLVSSEEIQVNQTKVIEARNLLADLAELNFEE
jgi:hypothetical protein